MVTSRQHCPRLVAAVQHAAQRFGKVRTASEVAKHAEQHMVEEAVEETVEALREPSAGVCVRLADYEDALGGTWASGSGWPESIGEVRAGLSAGGGRQDVREVLATDVGSLRARSQACSEARPELCDTE
ncbi:MAG: hypothetical protein ACKPKO_35840, partial [Candidatus Fonsibacter sp.]